MKHLARATTLCAALTAIPAMATTYWWICNGICRTDGLNILAGPYRSQDQCEAVLRALQNRSTLGSPINRLAVNCGT
jgi:hypothetical protein